jgi:hypothetical protein
MKYWNSNFSFIRPALFFALALGALTSCVTHSKVTIEIKDKLLKELREGTATLICVSCATAFGFKQQKLNQLLLADEYEALGIEVLSIGFPTDLSWYYLGRSAEGLGHLDAAILYYYISIDGPGRGGRFFTVNTPLLSRKRLVKKTGFVEFSMVGNLGPVSLHQILNGKEVLVAYITDKKTVRIPCSVKPHTFIASLGTGSMEFRINFIQDAIIPMRINIHNLYTEREHNKIIQHFTWNSSKGAPYPIDADASPSRQEIKKEQPEESSTSESSGTIGTDQPDINYEKP